MPTPALWLQLQGELNDVPLDWNGLAGSGFHRQEQAGGYVPILYIDMRKCQFMLDIVRERGLLDLTLYRRQIQWEVPTPP